MRYVGHGRNGDRGAAAEAADEFFYDLVANLPSFRKMSARDKRSLRHWLEQIFFDRFVDGGPGEAEPFWPFP